MRTQDSTLAFYINQLDNQDRRLYEPLVDVTWGRDIQLRTGITMSNESTSFMRSQIGSIGTQSATGKSWIGAESSAIPGVSINGERIVTPLRLAARELSFTSVELERSQLLGQPIDVQKMNALNILYQMEIDEQVYIGDTLTGDTGLFNDVNVPTGNVSGGAWGTDPDVIIAQVSEMLESCWTNSGYALIPNEVRVPPAALAKLASLKVSSAGNVSVLKYLQENTICTTEAGRPLNIKASKWLVANKATSTTRMVAYTNAESRVRFPMVPIRRETAYYKGISFIAPYLWALGAVEWVYPETGIYRDGI